MGLGLVTSKADKVACVTTFLASTVTNISFATKYHFNTVFWRFQEIGPEWQSVSEHFRSYRVAKGFNKWVSGYSTYSSTDTCNVQTLCAAPVLHVSLKYSTACEISGKLLIPGTVGIYWGHIFWATPEQSRRSQGGLLSVMFTTT